MPHLRLVHFWLAFLTDSRWWSNKNVHPGHNHTVSNSYVAFCRIFQGSIHLLSVLNNISSILLREWAFTVISSSCISASHYSSCQQLSLKKQCILLCFSNNPSQSPSSHVTECCQRCILCFWIRENCKCSFMVEAPEFLFHIAVLAPAKPSSFACRNGRDSCKEQFSENTMGLWGVLLSFSDTSSVELFYQMGARLRYMQTNKSFSGGERFSFLFRKRSRVLVPHLWDLLFVKS